MISFDSVTKEYPDGTVAVGGFSLEVASGETTVLVGPSGCGKTTCLRMVNRMVEPSSGRVLMDGRDTASFAPHELRRRIGYVIQQAGLFPHRTVLDNVATVPVLLGGGRRGARARAAELLELVGLPAELGRRYPAQLSGGQQQRVGIARALAADPPVLLMDEPFSAVDPVVREQLRQEFLRLRRELGKTVVLVTHDIDEAIMLGDTIAVMRTGGTLAQAASPDQLLSRPQDAFVAGFVGRDRGYRALAFADAGSLPLAAEPTARLGEPLAAACDRTQDSWLLIVDDQDAPQGWLATPPAPGRRATGTVTAAMLNLGGTLTTEEGTLREALDAALSSPSGRGVVVSRDGRLAGTVTASQVLARIEVRTAESREAGAPVRPPVGTVAPEVRP